MPLVLKRRSILTTGAMIFTGISSGCLEPFNGVSSQNATKVDFTEREGQHLLVVRNDRGRPVEATIIIVENESTNQYSNHTTIEAGQSVAITEPFTQGADSHTIRVETNNESLQRRVQIQGSPRQQSEFEISADGIIHDRVHRRTADISVANHRETPATFRITIDDQSGDEPPVFDLIELPPDGFESYTDVFAIGDRYDVSVEVANQRASISHRCSRTNGISVTLDEDGLNVGEFEQ